MRCCLIVGIVWAALAAASPAPVQAAPIFGAAPPGEGDEHHGTKPIGPEHGLFKGAVELGLWTIVVFLLLMFILNRTAWPQIREGLDRREKSIAHDRMEADRARKEAAEMREKLAQEMARANDQIRQMMEKARKDAEQVAAELQGRGRAELQVERERMLRELQIASDDALHKMWQQSAELATMISTRAIGKQLSAEDHRALLSEALADFRPAAQTRKENIESAHA